MIFPILFILFLIGSLTCEGAIEYVLVVGETANTGYVDVYNGSKRYSLCYDGWDDVDAAVVCYSIGYTRTGARALYNESDIQRYGIWDEKLDCNGNETSLKQCRTSERNANCSSSKSARVHCSTATYPGDFFLVDFSEGIGRMDRISESLTVVTSNVSEVYGIGYDVYTNTVIWTDTERDVVARCSINGGDTSVIYQAKSSSWILGIAVDSESRLIFYTDRGHKEIGTIDIDTLIRNITIDTGLMYPFSIAVDHKTREIFWTDTGTDVIEKASYDGESREVLVYARREGSLGLVLDDIYLYWCDAVDGVIERILRDGRGRTIIHRNGLQFCQDMTTYQDYLYCRDFQNVGITVFEKYGTSFYTTGSPALQTGYHSIQYIEGGFQ